MLRSPHIREVFQRQIDVIGALDPQAQAAFPNYQRIVDSIVPFLDHPSHYQNAHDCVQQLIARLDPERAATAQRDSGEMLRILFEAIGLTVGVGLRQTTPIDAFLHRSLRPQND